MMTRAYNPRPPKVEAGEQPQVHRELHNEFLSARATGGLISKQQKKKRGEEEEEEIELT